MDKKTGTYELLLVTDLSQGEETAKALAERFEKMISDNGTLGQVNEWGKRRLAYPINDLNEGYYTLINFEAPTDFPAELARVLGITDGVMRHMILAKNK